MTLRAAPFYSVLGRVHGDRYRRLFRAGGGLALIEFTQVDGDALAIAAQILTSQGRIDEALLWADVRHVINGEAERQPFYRYVDQTGNGALAITVRRLHGLHSFRFESLFDTLMITQIEQQISLRAAQLAERWLCAWGGDSLEHGGHTYYMLPSPERLAAASVDDLIPTKITFGRMARIIDLARKVVEGEFNAAALRDAPFEVIYPAVMDLKGVGHWTAAWALIRATGRYIYLGRADVALRAAVNTYYFGQTGRVDPDVMDRLFASFGDFAGHASYYTIMRYALEKYAPV